MKFFFFKKNGPIPPSFCLFSSFSHYSFNNWKKHRWCAWDSNPGPQGGRRRRNHGAMAATPNQWNSYRLWAPQYLFSVHYISHYPFLKGNDKINKIRKAHRKSQITSWLENIKSRKWQKLTAKCKIIKNYKLQHDHLIDQSESRNGRTKNQEGYRLIFNHIMFNCIIVFRKCKSSCCDQINIFQKRKQNN